MDERLYFRRQWVVEGEVGVACSMAAAGLAELLGGSPARRCVYRRRKSPWAQSGVAYDPVAGGRVPALSVTRCFSQRSARRACGAALCQRTAYASIN